MNDFPAMNRAFAENFEKRSELGASVSVWQAGKEIVSLHRGVKDKQSTMPWTSETLIPVFSATKGAAAASVLLALHQKGQTPQIKIGELWPTFPMPEASIAQALSHQCGLAALCRPASVFDHQDCVAALEQTAPAWSPPQHGYHPHTYGIILDEIMIRLTGQKLGDWWNTCIRAPLGIDFFIGLPESEFGRVGTLYPGKTDKDTLNTPFYKQYLTPGTPIFNAFHSLKGLETIRLMNTPAAWTCASPAFGGVASAKGLAQFYQACLGNLMPDLFPDEVRSWMATPLIDGEDLTMMTPTAFSCGFMLDPVNHDAPNGQTLLRHLFGKRGFGHAGAGGSHAFADPESGISFSYTMNQMDLNVLPGEKTRLLVDALLNDLSS